MKTLTILIVIVAALSACKKEGAQNIPTPTSIDTVNRRIDLKGTGVVNYQLVNAETPKDAVTAVTVVKVKSIQFYDNYIVVQAAENEGYVIKVADLIKFEWRQ